MTPPLQLEHYFFKRLLVDAHLPDGGEEPDFDCPLEVSTHVELYPHLEDEDRFQLRLIIERDAAELPPGGSILYGAAREHLLTVTGRGPWPALMLPTVSFVPERSDQ